MFKSHLLGTCSGAKVTCNVDFTCLFPFSLAGKAKEWLKSHPNHSLTSWTDVEEKICKDFFQSLTTSKQILKSLCSYKEQMKHYVRHGRYSK